MHRRTIFGAFVTFVAIAVAACSLQESPNERAQRLEPILAGASFHMHLADRPVKLDSLKSMTPLKMRYYVSNDKLHYWFADPVVCQCVYIGREENYQDYERLKLRQQMVQRQERAAAMNQEATEQEQMNFAMWPADPFFC
ncbi:MAG: hypothetical protein ACREQN_11070 [Candidatus Binataceae bacterium]